MGAARALQGRARGSRVTLVDQPEEMTSDVLPPAANQIMALLWIALFAGRWIGAPFLIAGGLLAPAQVVRFDETLLLPFYLILLVITVIVAALRAVRSLRPATPSVPAAARRDERLD